MFCLCLSFSAIKLRYRNPFLALLVHRFSYLYFAFNRRSENRSQVTSPASGGKPIVSIVVERRSLVNLSTSLYMEEGT